MSIVERRSHPSIPACRAVEAGRRVTSQPESQPRRIAASEGSCLPTSCSPVLGRQTTTTSGEIGRRLTEPWKRWTSRRSRESWLAYI